MAITENSIRVVKPLTFYDNAGTFECQTASFETNVAFTNFTKETIYTKLQCNIPITISPCESQFRTNNIGDHLEIRITYKLTTNDSILGTAELIRSLIENGHVLSEEADEFYKKLLDLYKRDGSTKNKTRFSFVITRCIPEHELHSSANIYVRECNMVFTRSREELMKPHPNSSIGLQQSNLLSGQNKGQHAGVTIKVVDNDQIAEVRYMYSAKQMITVPSIIDPECESGVYCTVATQGRDGSIIPVSTLLSFEEAEESIGLYKFKDDAVSNGNPELFLKAEEARHRAEERRATVELQKSKTEIDRITHDHEASLLAMKNELEHQRTVNASLKESMDLNKTIREDQLDTRKKKREHDKVKKEGKKQRKEMEFELKRRARDEAYERRERERKDYYDERSYVRKDNSELIKYIPALVLGAVGVIAIVKKIQES